MIHKKQLQKWANKLSHFEMCFRKCLLGCEERGRVEWWCADVHTGKSLCYLTGDVGVVEPGCGFTGSTGFFPENMLHN